MRNLSLKLQLGIGLIGSIALIWVQPLIDPYFASIISFAGINILLALSLMIVTGMTGQFSLGHAAMMAIGGYVSSMVTIALLPHFSSFGPLVFLTGLLVGGVAAILGGLVVGIPSLRLNGDYLAITTLGFGEVVRVLFQNMDRVGGARGLTGIEHFTNWGWIFGAVVCTLYTIIAVTRSTYGRGFFAIRDDEIAARSLGIRPFVVKLQGFILGSFIAGIAGGLYAHEVMYIVPSQFGFMKSIEILVMVIMGGLGHVWGCVAAAIGLTILPECLRAISEFRMVIYAGILIGVTIWPPARWMSRRRQP